LQVAKQSEQKDCANSSSKDTKLNAFPPKKKRRPS
jgi:hypothetical protein